MMRIREFVFEALVGSAIDTYSTIIWFFFLFCSMGSRLTILFIEFSN
jgi:hypothetical protein